MTTRFRPLVLAACAWLIPLISVSEARPAGPEDKRGGKIDAALTNDLYRPFLINNIFNYYGNTGGGSFNKFSTDNLGFELPKGGGKHLAYEDGIVWGGFHNGRTIPKVGGSVYQHALQAGPVLVSGTPASDPVAADPANPGYRLYRVRPDIGPANSFFSVQSMIQREEVNLVKRYENVTAEGIYNQYLQDWNEWPADLGAPFTDVDGDGVYEPGRDIPGEPGAGQTLWYVANDLSPSRVSRLYGSPPIGLEMQRTIWGYKAGGTPGNVIFARTVLVNRSGAPVDSMFLAQWSDSDVGGAGDDLVGCDTLRNLGYMYNGGEADAIYGAAVPAVGFRLLQGPAIPSAGDSARLLGAARPGFKNLPMTAFVFFGQGNAAYADPRSGVGGDIDMYNLMNGNIALTGMPFYDPIAKRNTKFVFSGDPVKATDGSAGWVDGVAGGGLAPQDRRMVIATGPFRMADGDTQEIILAHAGGLGPDRLSSITALRAAVDAADLLYRSGFKSVPPNASVEASFPSLSEASLALTVDGRFAALQKVSGLFRNADGAVGPSFELHDDGTDGDLLAGDKQFAGRESRPTGLKVLTLDLSATDGSGRTYTWPNALEGINVAGNISFTPILFSDNVNSDGIVNPGENIRFGVSATNQTRFFLTNLELRSENIFSGLVRRIPALAPGALDTMVYNQDDPATYFSVDVPSPFGDSLLTLPVLLRDGFGNQWSAWISFPVAPLGSPPQSSLVNPVSGFGKGAFEVNTVIPSAVKNRQYAIEGVTTIDLNGNPGFTLRDLAGNRVLLQNHPLPDPYGHNIPVTDGFKVLRGTIDVAFGYSSYAAGANGQRDISGAGADPTGDFLNYLEGFGNAIGTGLTYPFINTSVFPSKLRSVLLKFAAATGTWDPKQAQADTNFSRGYRFVRSAQNPPAKPAFAPWIVNPVNYGFQDYNYSVPFSAWDVDAVPPRRLAVGHLENNEAGGRLDGRYWPQKSTDPNVDNATPAGPREWFFIYDLPYSDTPDPLLGTPGVSTMSSTSYTVPLLWWGVVTRRAVSPNDSGYFRAGTELTIIAKHPPSTGQTWVFNPELLLSGLTPGPPSAFALEQNYPNPFNPATTIRYQIPAASHVTLRIYDLLGREVALLVSGMVGGGTHELRWDGKNAASGVYFYRLEATPQGGAGARHVTVRKMLLLR